MRADEFVNLLDYSKSTGKNRWLCRCPAHDDRSPSLTVSEGDDGRILIHCFAGCGANDVIAAVGVNASELFPPTDGITRYEPIRRREKASQGSYDEALVEVTRADVKAGRKLSQKEKDAVWMARRRLRGAV